MAGTRPRDSQWTKFNNVLIMVRPQTADLQSTVTANAFFAKVTNSSWWTKRYPTRLLARNTFTTCQAAWGMARYSHEVPVFAPCSKVDVLHQLAHLLAPEDVALHGPEFCKEYAGLVERFLGQVAKNSLLAAFRNHGVKSRTWSPEAKARAVERAAKNGTPFGAYGAQRTQAARDGIIDMMRDLAGLPPEPVSEDPIDRMLNAAAKEAK